MTGPRISRRRKAVKAPVAEPKLVKSESLERRYARILALSPYRIGKDEFRLTDRQFEMCERTVGGRVLGDLSIALPLYRTKSLRSKRTTYQLRISKNKSGLVYQVEEWRK